MSKVRNNSENILDPKVIISGLILGVVEFELFAVAKEVARTAGQDAWLSILLGSLLMSGAAYVFIRLAARFPGQSPFRYVITIWGKPIAFILGILYLFYWSFFLVLLSQDASMANQVFFLKKTPPGVPMLILAIAVSLLVSYGLKELIRFFQLNLLFLLLPLLFIFAISLRNIDLHNFQPVLANGFIPVIKGTLHYIGAMQGLEVILFIGPFLKNTESALKPALIGVYAIVALTMMQLLTSIGIMGLENTRESLWPGISAISLLELPGFPVERYELFLTLPWLVGVFTTLCLFSYFIVTGASEIFGIKNKKWIIFFTAGIITLAAYVFPSYSAALEARNYFSKVTTVFLYVVPLVTYIMAILRKKGGRGNG